MRTRHYPSDLTDAQWALVAPHIPAAKSGGRRRIGTAGSPARCAQAAPKSLPHRMRRIPPALLPRPGAIMPEQNRPRNCDLA
jgi:hypothetical protein